MENVYTLKEFLSLFKDSDKIVGLYLDDESSTIKNELIKMAKPLNRLHKNPNLLDDDSYIELIDGEYKFNKDKLFSDYSDYLVGLYFPMISDEHVDQVNLMQKTMGDKEYLENIAQYAYCCDILIREPFLSKLDPDFFPEPNSDIDCWLFMDYHFVDSAIDEPNGIDYYLTPVAMTDKESEVYSIISKRKELYTVVYRFLKGKPVIEKSELYYTNPDGTVDHQGGFVANEVYEDDDE